MNVGFLGLGAMGNAMAHNVLRAGHTLHVWNRTASSADDLVAQGARRATEPREVAGCEAVIAMFSDDAAFTASIFDSGLFDALEPATTFVNMATVSVALARDATQRFAARGIPYVAAPVLGRPDVAAAGKLNILAAGDAAALARVQPLFDAMGQKTWPFGDDPAHANVAKIAANYTIVSALETLAEAFAVVRDNGLDPHALHDLITSTIFAGSPIYKNYGSQILDQRFEAGFKLRLGLKDVRLALAAGEAVHAPLPFASALQDVMQDAVDAGDGDKDWTALARVIERRSQADPVAP
jgi:3-hydroxyisobutyrate dehydrogenase-like beta-hydroxyacid dehydrogenase